LETTDRDSKQRTAFSNTSAGDSDEKVVFAGIDECAMRLTLLLEL
jgi:hypothetical protein